MIPEILIVAFSVKYIFYVQVFVELIEPVLEDLVAQIKQQFRFPFSTLEIEIDSNVYSSLLSLFPFSPLIQPDFQAIKTAWQSWISRQD